MFLEEPAGGEGTVFVPVNSTTTFRCSVAEGYTLLWQVQRPGARFPLPATLLRQFELTEISPRSSMLSTIHDHDVTKDLNGTRVFCVAIVMFNPEGSEVLVIVYGKSFLCNKSSRLDLVTMIHYNRCATSSL